MEALFFACVGAAFGRFFGQTSDSTSDESDDDSSSSEAGSRTLTTGQAVSSPSRYTTKQGLMSGCFPDTDGRYTTHANASNLLAVVVAALDNLTAAEPDEHKRALLRGIRVGTYGNQNRKDATRCMPFMAATRSLVCAKAMLTVQQAVALAGYVDTLWDVDQLSDDDPVSVCFDAARYVNTMNRRARKARSARSRASQARASAADSPPSYESAPSGASGTE